MAEEVVEWADEAMYASAPMQKTENGVVQPKAYLLWGTPDPLGAIAAVGRMFKGEPTYNLDQITDEERRLYWDETFKSHLRAPHEFVQMHFFVEGVTRSHTHQMVRQRTATFAQESLRFAVKQDLAQETPLPPSIAAGTEAAAVWASIMQDIETAYTALVNSGIPAEDARGLLPHATTTRLHWRTNLNDLLHHAGNRLCTQAQFEWRILMMEVMNAMRKYSTGYSREPYRTDDAWQWELIAKPAPRTFAPICYHTGKCEFKAIFDRKCTIRERVDAFAESGVPSEKWGEDYMGGTYTDNIIPAIRFEEWLLNSAAAR